MRRLAQRGRWEERWGRTLGRPLWEGCCPRAASRGAASPGWACAPRAEALEAQDALRGRPPEGNNPPTRARHIDAGRDNQKSGRDRGRCRNGGGTRVPPNVLQTRWFIPRNAPARQPGVRGRTAPGGAARNPGIPLLLLRIALDDREDGPRRVLEDRDAADPRNRPRPPHRRPAPAARDGRYSCSTRRHEDNDGRNRQAWPRHLPLHLAEAAPTP